MIGLDCVDNLYDVNEVMNWLEDLFENNVINMFYFLFDGIFMYVKDDIVVMFIIVVVDVEEGKKFFIKLLLVDYLNENYDNVVLIFKVVIIFVGVKFVVYFLLEVDEELV